MVRHALPLPLRLRLRLAVPHGHRGDGNDHGVAAIAQMLCVNKTIEYVNLESNEFGERGACCLSS